MNHLGNRLITLAILSLGIAFAFPALAVNSGVTYQGRILKPDGTPLSGQFVQFKLQIRTPDGNDCLLYEETKPTIDMRQTSGAFSVTMNDGTGVRTNLLISDNGGAFTTLNVDRMFSNSGNFAFDPTTCTSGSTYTPNSSDGRNLLVLFKDETMPSFEEVPAQKINFVPFAFEAKQVAGYTPASLVRVADGTTLGNISPLSNADYTKLLDLISGTSATYQRSGYLGGGTIPLTSSLTTGQVLSWNGSNWAASTPGGAGSVGTSAIVDQAVTATKLAPAVAGTAGQLLSLDGSGNLIWSNAPNTSQWTTQAPGINYMGGNVGIGTTSPTSLLHVAGTGAFNNYLSVTSSDVNDFLVVGNDLSTAKRRAGLILYNYDGTGFGGTPEINLRQSRGTVTAQTATQANDVLGLLNFQANRGGVVTLPAQISAIATQTQTAVNNGGALAFSTTANGSATLNERMRVDASGYVGIGTTSPITDLQVSRSGQTNLIVDSPSGASNRFPAVTVRNWIDGGTTGQALLNLQNSRGNSTTSAPLNSGDSIGTLQFLGVFDTANTNYSGASMRSHTEQAWTTSNRGTNIRFNTTSLNSNTLSEKMRISADGNVGIGTTSPLTILDVQTNDISSSISLTNTDSTVSRYPAVYVKNYQGAGTGSPAFSLFNMGGTAAAPTAQLANRNLGTIGFYGSTDTAGSALPGAVIRAVSQQPFSTTASGSYLSFATTPLNTTAVSEAMRITAAGNVGIRTTSPTALMHLGAGTAAASTAPLKLTTGVLLTTPEDGAFEYASSVLYYTIGSTRYVIPLNASAANYSNVSTISNSSGHITMTPFTGNSVIINSTATSTTPLTGGLLVSGGIGVTGAVNASSNISSGGSITGLSAYLPQIFGGSAASANIKIDGADNASVGNVLLATAGTGGRVGIGTTVPTGTLDVQGGTAAASTAGQSINLVAQNGGPGGANGGNISLFPGTGTSAFPGGSVIMSTNATSANQYLLQETLNRTDSYTGTGTTINGAPSAMNYMYNGFYGNGNTALTNYRVGNSMPLNQYAYFGATSTAGSANGATFVWGQATSATVYNERMRLDSNGNVGIGTTSPTDKLHVSGDIRADSSVIAGGGTANYPAIQVGSTFNAGLFAGGSNSLAVSTATVERMRVLSNGNVGIGTTAPASILHVSGAAPVMTFSDTSSNSFASLGINTGQTIMRSHANTGGSLIDLNPTVGDGTSTTNVRFFRTTNSSGAKSLQIYRGDATATADAQISSGTNANTFFAANGGRVGIGTNAPAGILDLSSTTQGLVLPRMTKAQRNAISSPVAGTAVYQTDSTPGLRVYDGANWMRYTETID